MVQKTIIQTGNGFLRKFALIGTIIIAVGAIVWAASSQLISDDDLSTYISNADDKYFSKEKGVGLHTTVENLVEKVGNIDTSYKELGDEIVSIKLLLKEVTIIQKQIMKDQQRILKKLE